MQSAKPSAEAGITSWIVSMLAAQAQEARVIDVRIGLGYTAVMLTDNHTGVAYTFREEAKGGCSVFRALRPMVDRPASDLLALLASSDPIEAAVGLACANALANKDDETFLEGDILDHLGLNPTDKVGMVGSFGPLIKALDERNVPIAVFERTIQPGGRFRPIAEAKEVLPRCQIALITATSIINGTIGGVMPLTRGCREVVILGASTPLLPDVFSATNVTMLSGLIVNDATNVLRVVSEGGGMRQFSPYVRKVSLRLAGSEPSGLVARKPSDRELRNL